VTSEESIGTATYVTANDAWCAYGFIVRTDESPSLTMQINIGDVWKVVAGVQINIGDAWKVVPDVKVNIADAWK